MFSGNMQDDWKWLPLLLLGGALAFLFFDPLGMKDAKITYVINTSVAATPTPVPPVVPPAPPPVNPPVAGFPTSQTTGPQPAPTQDYTGPLIVNENGATVENVIVRGCLQIVAENVTLRNIRVEGNCPGAPVISHVEGTGLQVITSEIIGVKVGTGVPTAAVSCGNCTIQGSSIRGTVDGLVLRDGSQATGNYIGQLGGGILNGNVTRNTGVTVATGATVVVRGNTIDSDCAVSRQEAGGTGVCDGAVQLLAAVTGATLEGNYFQRWNGPAGSVTSAIIANGATNIRVLTNTFGNVPTAYCTIQNGGTITEWTGNVLENNAAAARNC